MSLRFLALSLALGLASSSSAHVIVETRNGRVKGRHETSHTGKPFVGFHSIPYAEPPVGELRFNVRK